MLVLTVPLRRLGKPRPKEEVRNATPIRADLRIEFRYQPELGRQCRTAWLNGALPLDVPLPPLHDAEVNSMVPNAMIVTGVEIIDGVAYGQSWWCRDE